MKLEALILARQNGNCELCQSNKNVSMFAVLPQDQQNEDNCIAACNTCIEQIEKKAPLNSSHWRCLEESMWSEIPGVQVTAWRMLQRLKKESWAAEKLDMLYLDEANLAWAKASGDEDSDGEVFLHRDCNGQLLHTGDSVVLTKSLDVKGSSLNAKMGTVVKNIKLVDDNIDQIEGKIEGQLIVILTKFVRLQAG